MSMKKSEYILSSELVLRLLDTLERCSVCSDDDGEEWNDEVVCRLEADLKREVEKQDQ